jgi:two-component system, chemotaxis family, chemotaxis protein CheY
MTRSRPTRQLTRLDPTRELVSMVIEFDGRDDFLAEYDASFVHGVALIETERPLVEGTRIELRLTFPGLLVPFTMDGVAMAQADGGGIRVKLHPDPGTEHLIDQIRRRDRSVVTRVVRILIVEDNTHVAELVANGLTASARRELSDVMFTCTTAADGAAALEIMKGSAFDAAIVDVYLPLLDGPGFIRHVRTSLGLVDLPIVTMSGGAESARNAALRAGASAFLDKPVRLRQVIDTMRQLIKL